jgi:hypothetical protein
MKDCCSLYVLLSTVLWYTHLITNPHPVYGQCSLAQGIGGKVVVEARRTDYHQAHPLEVLELEWETGTSKELRPRRSDNIKIIYIYILYSDFVKCRRMWRLVKRIAEIAKITRCPT